MISTRVLPRTNFNPRSPDGERRSDHCRCHYRPEISIHAPRMGSDYAPLICFNVCSIFQSTLPGWGATKRSDDMTQKILFQSTLPGWGATEARHPTRSPVRYFNPRSPDGERRFARECRSQTFLFQSTLPGWGATFSKSTRRKTMTKFQSTLPGWGATADTTALMALATLFQSTLPGWGATRVRRSRHRENLISIHAPRMGSDILAALGRASESENFNPRSPDGERPRKWTSSPTIWAKSSIFNTDCIADRH